MNKIIRTIFTGEFAFVLLLGVAIYNGTKGYLMFNEKFRVAHLTLFSLFFFFLLNANTSGDITDNRILFAFSAMMIISPYLRRDKQ